MPEQKKEIGFKLNMERTPLILGLIYLPVHIFLLPLLLNMYASVAPTPPSDVALNAVYYCISAAFVLIVFRRCLRADFDPLLDRPLWNLLTAIEAYFVDMLLAYAALMLTETLGPGMNPTEEAGAELAAESRRLFGVLALMAPLAEELLFRGVVFGGLRRRSRWAAYAVSVAVYALYGVWQYVWQYGDMSYLIYAVQFVPAGLALAWCYERSGSIWLPILLHMALNAMSLTAV